MKLTIASVLALAATSAFASPVAFPAPVAYEFSIARRALNVSGVFDKAFVLAERKNIVSKYNAANANYKKATAATKARIEATAAKSVPPVDINAAPKGKLHGSVNLIDDINSGLDEEYYANIKIGTPSQQISIDFDTGSSDLWVPTTLCAECTSGTFNTGASSTYAGSTTPFQITYGSGAVVGTLANDTVTVGGLTYYPQTFGAVDVISTQFVGDPAAGILGLAFTSIASSGATTFFENLIATGKLASNQFAFYLTRQQQEGSKLCLGAYNSKLFTGAIKYTKLLLKTYFEVTADALYAGTTKTASFPAAIDTGTTLIYVPTAIATAFYAGIPGSASSPVDGTGAYTYPCTETLPVIQFSFGGNKFSVDPKDINIGSSTDPTKTGQCVSAIMAMDIQDTAGNNFAVVGDVFLKSWYSIYDFSNGGRVGFAKSITQ